MFFDTSPFLLYSNPSLPHISHNPPPPPINSPTTTTSPQPPRSPMEKSDKETHNFMNVESFSQLPFIRPSSIRLFGKEFGADSSLVIINDESDSNDTTIAAAATTVHEESKESGESNRKFECHYCCRNFPTSQALGGHQNAHKRERQHAKRAHLQSSMFHVGSSFTEAQMYGLMNYHRVSAAVPPYYHHHQQPPPPSWRTSATSNPYSTISSNPYSISSSSHQTPINGSPLATWRFPAARNLAFSDRLAASRIGSSGSNSQIRYSYEQKTSVQDQVSLDLHL